MPQTQLHSLVDLDMDIQPVSIAIATMLNTLRFDIDNKHSGRIAFVTRPRYNGREQTICLAFGYIFQGCMIVNFGQHRNDDNIFVEWNKLDCSATSIDVVTGLMFTEESYKKRRYFNKFDFEGILQFLHLLIREEIELIQAKENNKVR